LTATPASGSVFSGWSGGCSGTSTCRVQLSTDQSVTATFSLAPCVVPKLKGRTLAAAKRSIKSHYCSVGAIKRATSRKVKKGRVISQKPRPGNRLAHGAKIDLRVSKGR
jgi:beta-lactam-binding protein with PASTA domain